MSRLKRTALLFLVVPFLLSGSCKHEKNYWNSVMNDEKKTSKEIVCWGDSMTFGIGVSEAEVSVNGQNIDISYLSYPEILWNLTGINTYNFGIPGATSEEIAIMQGGLLPNKDILDYDTIDGNIMFQANEHTGDILVLEMGSNGGWDDYDDLISQYKAMISYSGCSEYIIIGDTDDPMNSADPDVVAQANEYAEEGIGLNETTWEAALKYAFGNHFINMRVYMIENGLAVAGLNETEADEEAARQGNISVQLRSDWTHFNSYGYYAQAVAVYQKGQELGYWEEYWAI